jgi:hypothetical protein
MPLSTHSQTHSNERASDVTKEQISADKRDLTSPMHTQRGDLVCLRATWNGDCGESSGVKSATISGDSHQLLKHLVDAADADREVSFTILKVGHNARNLLD